MVKNKVKEINLIITRAVAGPNRWTFKIKPIKELMDRYVGDGIDWIDPFAGMNSPAQWTNDFNEEMPTQYHMLADDFCSTLRGSFNGVIFDPPYSYRQITECYKEHGLKATQLDTSNNFYNRVMNKVCDKIVPGGYALSFGWNSNAFGKNRGFEVVEILLVAHSQHHNDTICTVEIKK